MKNFLKFLIVLPVLPIVLLVWVFLSWLRLAYNVATGEEQMGPKNLP